MGTLRNVTGVGLILGATVVGAYPTNARHSSEGDEWKRVEPVLTSLMARPDVAGASVAVIHNSTIAVARAYGFRMHDGATRVAMTPDTLLQAASLGKVATAVAALRLVERGRLPLDEDVNRLLLAWKLPENGFTSESKVTLRRLLSHSAGVTVAGFQGYPNGAIMPHPLQILLGQEPANSPPIVVGEAPGRQRYSGGGYQVIQRLLEDITGREFASLMRDEVFAPAGMGRSVFALRPPAPMAGDLAEGHALQASGELAEVTYQHPELAAAGLWSTPADLAKLVADLCQAWQGQAKRLLATSTVREMLKPLGDRGFGLGLVVREDTTPNPYFMHTGSNAGFRSLLIGFPRTGQGAVLMFNAEVDRTVPMGLLAAIAREFRWPPFSLR